MFEHLKKLDLKGKEAKYVIHQLANEPYLMMKPATEANKPYFNEVLRRSKKNMRAVQAGSFSIAMMDENRAQDRKLYPKLIITGWGNVQDSEGILVPYSEENCKGFLEALPDWIFDDIRAFAGNSSAISQNALDLEEEAGK